MGQSDERHRSDGFFPVSHCCHAKRLAPISLASRFDGGWQKNGIQHSMGAFMTWFMILQDALLVDGQYGSKTERGDFLKKSYPMNGASRELRESETQSKRDALIRVSRVGAESQMSI